MQKKNAKNLKNNTKINGRSGCDQIHDDLTKATVKNPHGNFDHASNIPKIELEEQ